jgi:hypothetical protein
MDMDRPRLAVVLSACILAALLLADAAIANAAVDAHPAWRIGEGTAEVGGDPIGHVPCPPDFPMCPQGKAGENWTYFALFVPAARGQVAQVNDAPMQGLPYSLYAFDSEPLRPKWILEQGFNPFPQMPTAPAEWSANLLRPSRVHLSPIDPSGSHSDRMRVNRTHRLEPPDPAVVRAVRTGTDPGGGIVFVWANRSAAQAPVASLGDLGFARVVAEGADAFDPILAGLHPWFAAAEGVAALGLATTVGWLLLTRRRGEPASPAPGEEPQTPGEEMLALLERSEGYLKGLRDTAVAGLAVFGLAGLLAIGPLAQQVAAVRTLHGALAAAVVGCGFAAAYAAVALLWALQVARVGRELRRLRTLRATAGP